MRVSAKEFVDALGIVSKYIPVSSISPFGEKVKLTSTEGNLTISSCDSFAWAEVKIPVLDGIESKGSWFVQGKIFSETAARIAREEEAVFLEINENSISIKGKHNISFATAKNENESETSQIEFSEKFSVSLAHLKQLINLTKSAVPKENHRPELCGIFLEKTEGVLNAVATDGVSLNWAKVENQGGEDVSLLIPLKPLDTAARLFPDDSDVVFSEKGNIVCLSAGNKKIYIPTIQRNYINYRKIFAELTNSPIGTFRVETAGIIEVLETVLAATDKEIPKIKLKATQAEIEVWSETSLTKFNGSIPCCEARGEGKEMCLNARLLYDAIKPLHHEKIDLFMYEPLKSPLVVKPAGSDEYAGLIMPIAIKSQE